MSSSVTKPSVTPRTALLARARASPCRALCGPRSPERDATSSPFSSLKTTPGGTGVVSSPLGPLTWRRFEATWTVTPLGTVMGLLPTRDMAASLPDVDEDLAAHALAGRALPRHEAARGGQDVDAQAAVHAGDLVLPAVDAAARSADPLQVGDHALHARAVLQVHAQDALLVVLGQPVVGDVALVLEDAGDLHLQLGGRDVDAGELGADPVPDPGDQVRDRIGHVHRVFPLAYQLALTTPGISPESDRLRKQMRHSWNFLR